MARGLIFAARHPRPRIGARICFGRLDCELAEPAGKGAEALLAAAAEPIERIIASPHRCASEVARAAARITGAPLQTDDRLAERDFGGWEGRPWAALSRAELAAWQADPLHARPGGGESLLELLARVRRAWTGIASSAENTLVVTHAGPIACLRHIADATPLVEAMAAGAGYGSVITLGARAR